MDRYPIPDGAQVVLGLDGSFSQDCTALVAVTCTETPHVDVAACWEPPAGRTDYRVPVFDVEQAVRYACCRWAVREIAADPFRWTRTLQALEAEGLPVVEYPQSAQRMTPATTAMFEAIVNNQMTHSGDPTIGPSCRQHAIEGGFAWYPAGEGTQGLLSPDRPGRGRGMAFDRARQVEPDYDLLASIG